MLVSRIPGIELELEEVRKIATSGFVLAINVSWAGPEYLHSEYPAEWREIYEDKNYFMFDPVFYWTLNNKGMKRWSEVGYPDPMGIAAKAKAYGLCFGAVFSEKVQGRRSFFTVCRPDREFTAPEMTKLSAYFNGWLKVVAERPSLSLGELQVLKCLRDGLSQSGTAEILNISESTVKQRARSAMKKFGAATRAEAVSIAVEKRYLTLDVSIP